MTKTVVTIFLKEPVKSEHGGDTNILKLDDCNTPQVAGPLYVVQHRPEASNRRRIVETVVPIHNITMFTTENVDTGESDA